MIILAVKVELDGKFCVYFRVTFCIFCTNRHFWTQNKSKIHIVSPNRFLFDLPIPWINIFDGRDINESVRFTDITESRRDKRLDYKISLAFKKTKAVELAWLQTALPTAWHKICNGVWPWTQRNEKWTALTTGSIPFLLFIHFCRISFVSTIVDSVLILHRGRISFHNNC